jgi:hypothetical protein
MRLTTRFASSILILLRRTFPRVISHLLVTILVAELIGCSVQKTHRLTPAGVPHPEQEHIVGITNVQGEDIQFDRPGASIRADTVHASVKGKPYEIALSQVQRLWVLRKEPSTARTIGLVAAVAVGAVVALAAIFLATKNSCPFVYSWDGSQYVFDAEPYGGAVTRGLERDDYSELEHLRPQEGFYRLMIRNEVPETQFTNLMELWVVDRPPGIHVVADDAGKLHAIVAPQKLIAARDDAGRDLLRWLSTTDRLIWEPEPIADSRGSVRSDIDLTFPKPRDATRAKLVTRVATGLWGSYMIRDTLKLYGRELDNWYSLIDGDPAEAARIHEWSLREELYALKVYVQEQTGWEFRGVVRGQGPFIAEDRVTELDVSRVQGDQLRIRIRPPLGFWALDSFAVDYTADPRMDFVRVAPVEARDASEKDVLADLLKVDDAYYAMPQIGDRAWIRFPVPASTPGTQRTVFLHTRGYYRLHLTGSGEPDLSTLTQIQQVPDFAARLAARRYADWRKARPE